MGKCPVITGLSNISSHIEILEASDFFVFPEGLGPGIQLFIVEKVF